jgi:DNA-binding beta-propeller fold protein YncE
LPADLVFGASGSNLGELNRPLGMAIGADGNLYVAEEGNNRVQVFNTGGEALRLIAPTESPNVFVRPNGVDVAADGSVVVADTWNFRVQVLSPEGELRNVWGERGEYGPAAVTEPIYGFWGPRAVTVDDEGRIYVADTGNKRVRVYTETGAYVRDIGGAGTSVGQLEEPVGLAIHPDGRLFVADTWNRRISVFSLDGTPLTTFPVRAWYDEQGNRPYLALDVERNRLYVTDPDAGRVLVYDTAGNCLGSFGQASREAPGANQFSTVGGIAVDPRDGSVYVADAGSGRILKFPVIEFAPAPPAEATPEVGAQG